MTSRTRNRTVSETADWLDQYHYTTNSCTRATTTSETSGTMVVEEKQEEMVDVVTPQFKKLSGEGRIINNPLQQTIIIDREGLSFRQTCVETQQWLPSCNGGHYHYELNDFVGTVPASATLNWYNKTLPNLPVWDGTDPNIDKAVSSAWSNVSSSDIQSLVMAAESQKTVLSLASIFRRFIKILKKIKRLDAAGLASELSAKELADRYMELRYALRPLMYDARGVVKAINTRNNGAKKRLTFRGSDSGDCKVTSSESEAVTYPAPKAHGWDIVTDYEAGYDMVIRAGVLTELEESTLTTWGVTQPIESLWELVPFSFVIDWFFNVGDVISAWTPNYGINSLASWYTQEYIGHQKVQCSMANLWGTATAPYDSFVQNIATLTDCYLEKITISKTRVPNPSRQVIPSFTLNLDMFKLTDLVIIAKQIWR